MEEKIDQLIDSLNEIKKTKLNREKEINNIIEEYNKNYFKLKDNTEVILQSVETLKEGIEKIDHTKEIFFQKLSGTSEKGNDSLLRKKNKNRIRYKKFNFVESPLTILFENDHYQTLYNIFMSFLLILLANFITSVFFLGDNTILNVNLFYKIFSGFFTVIGYSFLLTFISFGFVIMINLLLINKFSKGFISILLFGCLSYLIVFFTKISLELNISMICKTMYSSEIIRICQKILSYYFEKVLKVTYMIYIEDNKLSNEIKQVTKNNGILIKDNGLTDDIKFEFKRISMSEEINNFFYFYFCPTLIYRDEYPMKKETNWNKCAYHTTNLLLSILFNFIIIELMLSPYFSDKILVFIEKENLLQSLINIIIISLIMLFVTFFGIAHSYFNLTAEILKFGDRKFYGKFWNSTSPEVFYHKLIFNWYEFYFFYVQKVLEGACGKYLAYFIRIGVFCCIYEYIFFYSLGFFYPITTVLVLFTYSISFAIKHLKTNALTLLCWMIISLGFGLLIFTSLIGFYFHNISKSESTNNLDNYLPNNFVKWIIRA